MANPLVSVLIPVYNGGEYLREALESALNQSIHNVEVIVSDDGSTDNSLSIAQDVRSQDSRVKIITQNKGGIVSALNEAIKISSGEYIARLDADDICYSYRFEHQMKYLIDNGLDLCGSQIELFGASTGIKKFPCTHDEFMVNLLTYGKTVAHPAVFAKSSVYKCFQYKDDFPNAEDLALWLDIAVNSSFKFGNCDEVLLKYRVHDKQVSKEKKSSQRHSTDRAFCYYIGSSSHDFCPTELHANSLVARQRKKVDDSVYVDHLHYMEKLIGLLTSKGISSVYFDKAIARICNRGVNYPGFPVVKYLSLMERPPSVWLKSRLQLKAFYSSTFRAD